MDKSAVALDIDFENFTIEKDRATQIRSQVEHLKTSGWIDQWKMLLAELGHDEIPAGDAPALPGILPDQNLRLFRVDTVAAAAATSDESLEDSPESEAVQPASAEFSVALQAGEMRVYVGNDCLVELSFLPKEDDYAVFFINEAHFVELEAIMAGLASEIKAAKAQKSSRGNTWKERFSKG